MTQQRIVIQSERIITTTPVPGSFVRQVSVTYQLPPRPPNVIFIPEDDLPDLVFLRDNPDKAEAPADLVAAGNRIRRERIEAKESRRLTTARRTI